MLEAGVGARGRTAACHPLFQDSAAFFHLSEGGVSSYTLLHYRYLHSAHFLPLWSKPHTSVFPSEDEMRRGTIPGPTWPGFNHTGPCAAPSFMEGEAASPSLPPSVIPTLREDARTSNIHIMPDCSSLSRHTAPQNLASLLGRGLSCANPLSLAVSCVSSALRSFWPVWPQMRLPPMPVLLGSAFRALSLNRRPSGFWQRCLLDCASSSRLLHICCPAGLASSEHHILCSPATFSKKRLRTLHLRKISSLIPCNASALVGWDKMSFCVSGYQWSQEGWKKEETEFSFSLRKSQEIQITAAYIWEV